MAVRSLASTVMPPVVASTSEAFEMEASTTLAISFLPSDTPIDSAAPTTPAPSEMAAAPAKALIVEASPAETRMSSAEMPVATTPGALSPSMAS